VPENADARRLPGPGELRILTVLWENGPSTVREVYEAVSDETGWGYTTALKMLQLMHEKRLVIRDTSNTAHTYAAAASAARTRRAIVDDLLHRVYG
jgi:predicted transcriptional regulator